MEEKQQTGLFWCRLLYPVIFEEEEGGNHFMFMENPEKFNRLVREFMG